MKAFILLLLLMPFAMAETTVEKYGSGIIRGAWEHEVTIDHDDAGTATIDGVRVNDIITVIYGKGPTGLDLKTSYFMKTFINDGWRYEILKGERNLAVKVDESIELDYDNDDVSDIFLTLTEWDGRVGTFAVTVQTPAIIEPEPTAPEPEVEPEPEVVEVDEGLDDLGLTEVEEPVRPPRVDVVPEPAAPEQTAEESTAVLAVLIGVLLLAVLGAVAYTFVGGREKPKTPVKKAKK